MNEVHKVRLIYVDVSGNNNKFWEGVLYDNDDVETRWGRVGKNPQTKSFPGKGRGYLDKKQKEKERKGYTEQKTVEAGTTQVKRNGDLNEIAKSQIKTNNPLLTKLVQRLVDYNVHQITANTQINFDVVISDDNLHVNGDENQLIQALRNVLQNSVESILDQLEGHQDFDGQIRIEAKSGAQGIDIVVSDNGRGMDREHQSQAMNPLFTTKDVSTHSGLGLTIAHQIVADHNGKLEIFSQPMAGTAVKMSFPQSRFQGQETSF